MSKTIFTATIFSAFLIAGGACAQGSDQGAPHASSNPAALAVIGTTTADMKSAKQKSCEKRWQHAQINGTIGGQSHDKFMASCTNN
jgi:hypothetical protein